MGDRRGAACHGLLALLALGCLVGARAHRGGSALTSGIQARQRALEAAWSRELASSEASASPVKRVVELLAKMKQELTSEASSESDTYDKMVCWCETNEKEKTQAIKDADAKDVVLMADVEGRSARFGELSTEIAQLKAQIAEDTESLRKAQALREGAAASARGEDKSLAQAITNLRNAIAVLAKHHGNLLQLGAPLISSLQVLLRDVGARYGALVASQARHDGGGSLGADPEEPQAALLALGASTERAGEQQRQGRVGQELLGALMGRTAEIPDVPVDMAVHLVARSARGASRAGVFLQVADGKPQSYSPRSGEILGVLKRMLEEFEAQLDESRADEGDEEGKHQELSDAKAEQIDVAKQKLDDLEADAASNQKALSDAKEDLAATRKQRSADAEFLRQLKKSCRDLDADWEKRSETRSEEIKAVSEAISILTEDENRETMTKSLSFVQRAGASAAATARRARAATALRRAASDSSLDVDDLLSSWQRRGSGGGTPAARAPAGGRGAAGPRARLLALATALKIDSFTEVKEMIDKMVAELKEQQKEEAKLKAHCMKELDANEKATYHKEDEKKELESTLDMIASSVKSLEQELKDARAQIAQTEVEVKKAGGAREKENAEFQTTVAGQRATQTILKKALQRLKDFYSKGIGNKVGAGPSFVQRASQTPPEQFTAYKTNSGASPVIALLESILDDSKKLEAEAVAGERRAQADYEAFVQDSAALTSELKDAVDQKMDAKGSAQMESAETRSDIESAASELESLQAMKADVHGQCDFVLKNFDTRQKARQQEMEAIQSAKAILSGSRA